MPLFRYKAVTKPGEILEGDMEAPTRAAVIEQLRVQGYLPIRAEEAGAGLVDLLRRDVGRKRSLSHRDMTMVIRETATLLRAGLPVDQSLDVLVRFAEKPRCARCSSGLSTRSAAAPRSPMPWPHRATPSTASASAWSALARPAGRWT